MRGGSARGQALEPGPVSDDKLARFALSFQPL